MAHRPSITRSEYAELCALREALQAKARHRLVPVRMPLLAGSSSGMASIMFFGQTTGGEVYKGAIPPYEKAAALSARELSEQFLTRGRSVYWGMVRRIAVAVAEKLGIDPHDRHLHEAVGWSNIVKIGFAKGTPNGAICASQAALGKSILRAELARSKAHSHVFLISNYEQKFFEDVVGRDWHHTDAPKYQEIAWRQHPEFGLLIWGYHPREMRKKGRDVSRRHVDLIVERVVDNHRKRSALVSREANRH